MKIGIVGYGFVGQSLHSAIKNDVEVYISDPLKGIEENPWECPVVFICLPTPTIDGKQDASIINEILARQYSGIIVMKSTVLNSNLDRDNLVYNPEFLNQNSAVEDFRNQKEIILGGLVDHCKRVEKVYRECFDLPKLKKFIYLSKEEASNFKYFHNIYHAYKALFWHYVQDMTGNTRLYSKLYKEIVKQGNEMDRICADGKPGVGGACFPKDLIAFGSENRHNLTSWMIEYNRELRPEEMEDKL